MASESQCNQCCQESAGWIECSGWGHRSCSKCTAWLQQWHFGVKTAQSNTSIGAFTWFVLSTVYGKISFVNTHPDTKILHESVSSKLPSKKLPRNSNSFSLFLNVTVPSGFTFGLGQKYKTVICDVIHVVTTKVSGFSSTDYMDVLFLMVAMVTGSNEAFQVFALSSHVANAKPYRMWRPLVESPSCSLTSGSAAPLSAPWADAWPPRSGYWPAPFGGPASSPLPSSHSEWDKHSQPTKGPRDAAASWPKQIKKSYTYMQNKDVWYSFYMVRYI